MDSNNNAGGEYVSQNCIFGYALDSSRKMMIDKSAAETVKLIFELRLKGKSLSQIAEQLYRQKCPTPREYKRNILNPSCIWSLSVIRKLLGDEQYTGIYIAGRKKKNRGCEQISSCAP